MNLQKRDYVEQEDDPVMENILCTSFYILGTAVVSFFFFCALFLV